MFMSTVKELTCVVCPVGCKIKITHDGEKIESVEGNRCDRGYNYAVQEIKNPLRTLVTSVKVNNGNYPLASVRSSKEVPLNKINDLMDIIKNTEVDAPVKKGDVVIENPLDLGADIVATRSVDKE
jgi:CxxC motif-containing protein